MIKKILTGAALSALVLSVACAPKAGNTNTGNSNASNANSAKGNTNTTAPAKTGEKKETKLPADKATPVPADWVKLSDEVKGYEFQVPAGTQGQTQKTPDGVDVYVAAVPAPYEVGVMVFAFNDKTKTKDDLMAGAKAAIESMGDKDVVFLALAEITPDYSIAQYTSVDAKGKKSKGNILVATDVSDNYVMLIGCDEDKYTANEKTIDAIWGSFAMYSGGASGTN
jgi:hypothetical protein